MLAKMIREFKAKPEIFGNNKWRCYEACKRHIYKMQKEGMFTTNKEYSEVISLVTEALPETEEDKEILL